MLAITRGALVPAGMLAYRLGIRNILVAAVAFYFENGEHADQPLFLQFPADPLLHGNRVLIVDEVWDTGTTIQAVIDRVKLAGGVPTSAVLHYKPDALGRRRRARPLRREHGRVGGLPVQGGRLTASAISRA